VYAGPTCVRETTALTPSAYFVSLMSTLTVG